MKTLPLIVALLVCTISIHAQIYHVNEDFDSLNLPSNWSNSAVSGTNAWQFGIDASSIHAGNQNFNGTGLVYFDDDALGSGSLNNTTSLSTPVFNNSTSAITTLEFDYNLRIANGITDSFFVDVWDGSLWQRVFSRSINDCGNWIAPSCVGNYPHAVVNISAHANANCQVRFTYHDGNNWGWYVGFDNVQIYSPAANDIQVSEVISPISACGLGSGEIIQVKIKNIGTAAANNFTVSFDIDNGSQLYTDTINTSLLGGDSLVHTFNNTANFSQVKPYLIKAYTVLAGDAVTSNDTTITTITNILANSLPFSDDFEGANNWTVSGTSASWALGTPNGTFINTAYSGSNAYVTNLSGTYNNNEVSYLTSPCLDFSQGVGDPFISFRLNHITEAGFDSLDMEYTLNNGLNWQKIPAISPIASNWYNSGGYWDGNSNGWFFVQNVLLGLGGNSNVQIRFRFQSDGSTSLEGVAIDDITITHPSPKDIVMNRIISPTGQQDCGLGVSPVIVEIQNMGTLNIDTVELNYQINNGTIYTDTLITNIPSFAKVRHQFSTLFNFTGVSNINTKCWAVTRGDVNNVNDTAIAQSTNTSSPFMTTAPLFEDFETFPNGSGNTNGWTATPSGAFNYRWFADDGGTPSFGTGPTDDHTPGLGTKYMYTEASVGNGQIATIETPCIDMTLLNSPKLEFWYHKHGVAMGDLYIDIFNGSNWINGVDTIIGQTHPNQTDPYLLRTINLSNYAGLRIKVAFRASGYTGFQSDMAIDDVRVYDIPQFDAEMVDILSPNVLIDNCFSGSTPVTVEIGNNGTNTILANSILVYYQIDNNSPVVDTVITSLVAASTTTFTFSTPANFSTVGNTYNLKCWTQLSGDLNISNDSAFTSFTNHLVTSGSVETFEGTSFIDGACNDPQLDVIGSGWNVSATNYTWNLQNTNNCIGPNGATPTINTGPNGDHTTGSGQFFYTEADPVIGGVANGQVASLTSPCIDFTNDSNAALVFWYHKYGPHLGALHVDIYVNGNWINGISTINGQVQTTINDPWLPQAVNISTWAAGNEVQIRFRGIRGPGSFGDMAIDDVEFLVPISQDARVDRILSPISDCNPNDTIEIQITNSGTQAITTPFMAAYRVNGGPIIRSTVSSSIAIGQSINFSFPTTFSFSQSNVVYALETWTELPNDSNAYNDTLAFDIINTAQSLTYLEDFEMFIDGGCANIPPANVGDILQRNWKETSTGTFQWAVQDSSCAGTPSLGTGPSVDHTTGFGTFLYTEASGAAGGTAVLESPCIDLTNETSATLEFWYHRFGGNMGDLIVDVYDNGTWINGVFTQTGQNQLASTDPWLMASVSLNQYTGGEIHIRFRGLHGGGFQGDMAIDDIRLFNPIATGISQNSIDANDNIHLYPNPSNGTFLIEVTSDFIQQPYQIFNMTGSLIQEGVLKNLKSKIELENITSGVYLLRIGQSNLTRKLIIN